jgi:hypothetical protein
MPSNRNTHTKQQDQLVAEMVGGDVDETVTDADVKAAEDAAAAAEAAVELLERRIEDGTDLSTSPEEFEQARGESRFARLLAKGAERRAERAAKARRLRACDDLRREIESYVGEIGPECSRLLRQVEDATNAFVAKMDDRNLMVADWHKRAQALDVGRHHMPIMPPKVDGHLAVSGYSGSYNGRGVIAGLRRVDQADPIALLRRVMATVTSKTTGSTPVVDGMGHAGDPHETLAKLDGEFDQHPADTLFFRGENGGLFAFSPGNVPQAVLDTATPVSRKDIEKVSFKDDGGR